MASILSLDCSFLFNKLDNDHIGCGGHPGVFLRHHLLEHFPLIIALDPREDVEDVHLLTHFGNCLCIICIDSISVSRQSPMAEIVIIDNLIDLRCVVVNLPALL